MGRYTHYALYVALATGTWLGFKTIEPGVFPVISQFTIAQAIPGGDGTVRISGSFYKARDCHLIDIVGYSGETYVNVIYREHPYAPSASRLPRLQTYGPWTLVPQVPHLEIHARHLCTTGTVTTRLFSGALVL